MRKLYLGWALVVLGLYGAVNWIGWSPWASANAGLVIPASVRQSPGGYRNYTYWRGGK